MDLNWTQIFILVIGLVFTVLTGLITKQVIPWLKERKLYDAAMIAVHAAEALYGRYHGEDKLAAALKSLTDKGYDVQSEPVIEALNAAWKDLDRAMIDAGEKEVPGKEAFVTVTDTVIDNG